MTDDPVTFRDIGWADEPREVTERTYYLSQFSGVTAFETDEGLVLVDSGLAELAPDMAETLRSFTDAPVHTAIFTHGHADHVHGLEAFLRDDQDPPRVIAHRNVPRRWARYERTQRHNDAINARQFGGAVETAEEWYEEESNFRTPEITPTLLYDERLEIEVGGVTFELESARGETDDHTWVYCPDREVLCSGDFFISMAPNAGNPQKVQRYPEEWARTLRRMVHRSPRHLCPGHGQAVVDDPELIDRMLTETAAYLEAIVEATLEELNDGSPPHVDIVRAVEPPATDAPWLEEIYDESEFIVRNVIRRYGGWWSGRPSELKPCARPEVAAEIADLASGPEALAERAEGLLEEGRPRLACHLADYAVEAAPENERVETAATAVYEACADDADSLMAANLYSSARSYVEDGRPFR